MSSWFSRSSKQEEDIADFHVDEPSPTNNNNRRDVVEDEDPADFDEAASSSDMVLVNQSDKSSSSSTEGPEAVDVQAVNRLTPYNLGGKKDGASSVGSSWSEAAEGNQSFTSAASASTFGSSSMSERGGPVPCPRSVGPGATPGLAGRSLERTSSPRPVSMAGAPPTPNKVARTPSGNTITVSLADQPRSLSPPTRRETTSTGAPSRSHSAIDPSPRTTRVSMSAEDSDDDQEPILGGMLSREPSRIGGGDHSSFGTRGEGFREQSGGSTSTTAPPFGPLTGVNMANSLFDMDNSVNLDDEETEGMFSEWRFELAGQLSDQPELLQKMMSFMDRIEGENRDLKKEKQDQVNKVNELLREASDTLCTQVNQFLAEKDRELQAAHTALNAAGENICRGTDKHVIYSVGTELVTTGCNELRGDVKELVDRLQRVAGGEGCGKGWKRGRQRVPFPHYW